MFALFLFTFKGNIQCAKKVLRLAMEYADGDKCKIVYSLPEAMVEFYDFFCVFVCSGSFNVIYL